MQFVAKARFIRYSPYKLRPLVDVIRGKSASFALGWLTTYRNQRAEPIKKLIASGIANAKQSSGMDLAGLVIKDIRVDQGPKYRYFRPGAQGRAMSQTRRLCHISVILLSKA